MKLCVVDMCCVSDWVDRLCVCFVVVKVCMFDCVSCFSVVGRVGVL